ncbi:FMN-binding negative transcriptional regulator [Ochrobactrum sp. MYb379]|uniref:FMN-binding negative transcriptional regulator n=1 Tax=Ochrobactrum sp. MYb379 TaxID=2745275 RepID=UPI0030B5283C
MSDKFSTWSDQDLSDVVGAYPMASILGLDEDPSTLDMPVLLERDASGKPSSLLGHLPRRSTLVRGKGVVARAIFIFHGPAGYISPAMAGRSNWAPTWNFITVKIIADISTDDGLTDEALRRTVAHMEQDQPLPWSIDQIGERYEKLKTAIVGFRAQIVSVSARFKLGQDETSETFEHIVSKLDDTSLKYWMLRMREVDNTAKLSVAASKQVARSEKTSSTP